jgi:hypothetical protein
MHEAADAGYARLITLLMAAIAGRSAPLAQIIHDRAPSTSGQLLMSRLNALAAASARAIYRLLCYSPHWRIGWRHVDSGDVWDTHRLGPTRWQTFAGPGSHFYADPFPIVWQGRTFLFFEDFDHATGKGVISMAQFGVEGPLGPARVVLEEPWHLSYPHLIAEGGEVWMIPESSGDRAVHLYRADPFPTSGAGRRRCSPTSPAATRPWCITAGNTGCFSRPGRAADRIPIPFRSFVQRRSRAHGRLSTAIPC